MSAYLFIIVMEILSQIFVQHVISGSFSVHPKCKDPLITSLMFADDLVVFFKPTMITVKTIMDSLDSFYCITGLSINLAKSELMISGVSNDTINQITNLTSITQNADSSMYLGIPLATSRISYAQCIPLYERLTARLAVWTNRLLSQAGRLTLINSVMFSMTVYWSRAFILPIKLIKMIRRALSNFFWHGTVFSNKLSPCAFSKLEQPKSRGGLELRICSSGIMLPLRNTLTIC